MIEAQHPEIRDLIRRLTAAGADTAASWRAITDTLWTLSVRCAEAEARLAQLRLQVPLE
ncbi:hypothetical protein IC762_17655 [Bradyrhizobium genosp. L]|uniref:hypothetical protein n=1 Tax=Bradyrhizobium genosp. L TaxID=83637 RepID=UPI0018A30B21|nr:hypothetical protein [Bradyrhizobium genosp. L]QPF81652.1 hypothetical protein IC762_17655 [Bradyrhizobium genosp. L]